MTIEDEIKQSTFSSPYQKLAINLLYTCRSMEFFLKSHFKKQGLTMQQYNILRILRGSSPMPLSTLQIRERMIDKMSDTSRIVDRLLAKKLVTKKICRTDNRLVEIRITAKGLQQMEKLDDVDKKIVAYLDVLSVTEAIQANNLLDKIHSK